MNIYEFSFIAVCPVNGDTIKYHMRLETTVKHMAEKLLAICMFDEEYHENIADELYRHLGGRQTIKAQHGEVFITTHRGDE